MVEGKKSFLLGIHQVVDLFLVAIAYWLAFWLRKPAGDIGISYSFILLLAVICCHVTLRLYRVYDPFGGQTFKQIVYKIFKAVPTATAGIIFLMYILHVDNVSRLLIGYFAILLMLLLIAVKAVFFYVYRYNRLRDYVTRTVLIIGSRQRSIDLVKEIKKKSEAGYRIRGCLETVDQQQNVGNVVYGDVTIIGTMERFSAILLQETIDEVIFALPLKEVDEVEKYILFAENMGVNVRIMPDFQIYKIQYHPATARLSLDQFLGLPTISLSSTPAHDTALFVKSIIDYVGGALGMVLLSPLFALIALGIKSSSGGPVLFSQLRCGLNGRKFVLYKFRTMVRDADDFKGELAVTNEMDGPVFKIKNDPRITRFGRFLRKTSLDELPQLLNVVMGEMSLVGPRPALPEEVEQYDLWQRRRLSMKPGMTCIWQVSGRNTISFDRWMKMDLQYIDNWSLLLDFKILLLTVKEIMVGGGR